MKHSLISTTYSHPIVKCNDRAFEYVRDGKHSFAGVLVLALADANKVLLVRISQKRRSGQTGAAGQVKVETGILKKKNL